MRKNIKLFALLGAGATILCSCGTNVNAYDSQLAALQGLNKGEADVAIIDSVMAGYYTSNGEYKDTLKIVPDLVLSTEQYGIAGRKGDLTFMDKINKGLLGVRDNGKLDEVAEYFGVKDSLAINKDTTYTSTTSTDDSWSKIKESGKIVVGYTVFAPIAYSEADAASTYNKENKLTGFDIELAREVIKYVNTNEKTNLTLEFLEINWDTKEKDLTDGTIDLIWNGLTITDERQEQMAISMPYLNNNQVAVVKKEDADKYATKEAIAKAAIAVESGSAGEDAAKALN